MKTDNRESLDQRLVHQIYKESTCPKCGDGVFISKVKLLDPPHYGEDPEVMCREMGHWVGRLSECEKKEMNYGKVG